MAVLPPDPVYCLKSDMDYVHCLCFPEKENYNFTDSLIAGTESGFLHFWDLQTNRVQYKQKFGESIHKIHAYDQNIITQEKNGLVKIWTVSNSKYEQIKKYESYGGYCKSILIGKNLIVPQENSTLDVVDVEKMERISVLESEKEKLGNIMCLEKIDIKGAVYVLGGYESGDIILWDFSSFKVVSHVKLREYVTSLTFDNVTYRGICSGSSNMLQVFTINPTSLEMTLKCEISITNDGANVVKIRKDKKIFASGGWDGKLRLFSWKSLRLLVVLDEHKKGISDIQFSPKNVQLWNSNIMAASGGDGTISLWNLYN